MKRIKSLLFLVLTLTGYNASSARAEKCKNVKSITQSDLKSRLEQKKLIGHSPKDSSGQSSSNCVGNLTD